MESQIAAQETKLSRAIDDLKETTDKLEATSVELMVLRERVTALRDSFDEMRKRMHTVLTSVSENKTDVDKVRFAVVVASGVISTVGAAVWALIQIAPDLTMEIIARIAQ
ncbi:MAG: hypothetical protein R3C70_06980 [Geminicoccaceae bacterium]